MINLEKKRITIPRRISKTREDRRFDMQDNLVEWLRPYAKASGSILPASARGGSPSIYRYDRLHKEAQKVTGISVSRNSLRHSWCSYHYKLTDNADRTAEYAGHTVQMLKTNYRHSVEKEAAVEYFQIRPKVA